MRAVRSVALGHGEIRAWWYAPRRRLRLRGELPEKSPGGPSVEVVVEAPPSSQAHFDAIARELTPLLGGTVRVVVRAYLGDAEERHLFRLISNSNPTSDEIA